MAAMIPMLVNPARQHKIEQKQTSLMLRDEAGDGAPPFVDPDAGKARIKR